MKRSILIYIGLTFLASIINSIVTPGSEGLPYIFGVMIAYCIIPSILPLLILGISKLINKPVGKDNLFYLLYGVFIIMQEVIN